MPFPPDSHLEAGYQVIEVKTLAQMNSTHKPYQSIIDPKINLHKSEATITIAQAHYKTWGTQSLHAMLLVERFNQNGTASIEMVHLTAKTTVEEFFRGRIRDAFKTFTRGNFISTGEGIVDIRSLALKQNIKYHQKSPTIVISEENLGIMLSQVFKEKDAPPHFYLLSSHSTLITIRNLLRTNHFANNCIEWAVRMASYAGVKITNTDHQSIGIMNTTEYVGSSKLSFTLPGIEELAEFARAGNIAALNKYCSSFTTEQINAYVSADNISSSIREHSLGKMTALHLACIHDQPDAVIWLLQHGANPDLKTLNAYNALNATDCAKTNSLNVSAIQSIGLKRTPEKIQATISALTNTTYPVEQPTSLSTSQQSMFHPQNTQQVTIDTSHRPTLASPK